MNQRFIYLASASPRRRALLDQIGVGYRLCPVTVDERPHADESATACVRRLAQAKASAACAELGPAREHPVLAADTVVALDDEIFGKPRDREHGLAMLRRLSGRTHRVLTAVAMIAGAAERDCLSVTEVRFRAVSDEECARYWDSGEAHDKAGAYAVQGRAAVFVAHLAGSYTGVVGLPLCETAALLAQAGMALP